MKLNKNLKYGKIQKVQLANPLHVYVLERGGGKHH